MGLLDNARRKVKDWTTSDENIQGSPKTKVRELSAALAQLTPQERERSIEHVKAYLDYYYVAHQGEKRIPPEVHKQFSKMVEQSNRLTAVEKARVVLHQYGGAPTRETIENSLERSAQQRAREFSQYRVEPTNSREMSWTDLHPQYTPQQKQEHSQSQERERSVAEPVTMQQATPEPMKSMQPPVQEQMKQQAATELTKPIQQTSPEITNLPRQVLTEPTKSIPQMTTAELRTQIDQLGQRYTDLATLRQTAPQQEVSGINAEIKSVLASQGRYDTALTERLQQQRNGQNHEPSWKELHPKPENSQGQTPSPKHENKQNRSKGQAMEVSA